MAITSNSRPSRWRSTDPLRVTTPAWLLVPVRPYSLRNAVDGLQIIAAASAEPIVGLGPASRT